MDADQSLKEFTKNMLLRDAIAAIFVTYLKNFNLEDKFDEERFEKLTNKFDSMYHDYVAATFEDLDIQTFQKDGINYIGIDELMLKIAGVVSSKLAVEILLLELIGKLRE